MQIASPHLAPRVRLACTVLLLVPLTALVVQHVLNGQLDWRAVNYVYSDEIHVEPHGWKEWRYRLKNDREYREYRDAMEKLENSHRTSSIAIRPYANGDTMRRAIVQVIAHHEGAVARYGYALQAQGPFGLLADEIGFSNKYDEPMIVLAPPDVIEFLVGSADRLNRRGTAQRWISALPAADGKKPVPYADALQRQWPALVIRVEPAKSTVVTIMATILLAVGLAIWWSPVIWSLVRKRKPASQNIDQFGPHESIQSADS